MTQAGEPRYWALIAAAGSGARFGADGPPKQYQILAGRCVLEHSVDRFLAMDWIDGVVVVLAAQDTRFASLPCSRSERVHPTAGGAMRSDSVLLGLERIAQASSDPGSVLVLVHDAARPCIRAADLEALRKAATTADGGLLAVPVAETVKREDIGCSVETVDRRRLWLAQTPQLFALPALRTALEDCRDAGVAVTDEAAAMERAGHRPRLVRGHADNLKITTAGDLPLAEQVLAAAAKEAGA